MSNLIAAWINENSTKFEQGSNIYLSFIDEITL